MPGPQRSNADWNNFDAGDSETDSDSDGRVVRVYRGDTSDDEATPDKYCWLGDDEREDLGKVASVPARLDRIGWNDELRLDDDGLDRSLRFGSLEFEARFNTGSLDQCAGSVRTL